jgi:hypothetical protein
MSTANTILQDYNKQVDQGVEKPKFAAGYDLSTGQFVGNITEDSAMRRTGEFLADEGPAIAGIAAGLALTPFTGGSSLIGAGEQAIAHFVPRMALGVGSAASAYEATRQVWQRMTNDPNRPYSASEAAKRIAYYGIREGGLELVGGKVGELGARVLKPMSASLKQELVDVTNRFRARMREYTGTDVVLLPGEMIDNKYLQVIQNIAKDSIIGGSQLQKLFSNQSRFVKDLSLDFALRFAEVESPEALGYLIEASLRSKGSMGVAVRDVLYATSDAAIRRLSAGTRGPLPATVNLKPLKNKANKWLRAKRKLRPQGKAPEGMGYDEAESHLTLPDKLSLDMAMQESKHLGQSIRNMTAADPGSTGLRYLREQKERLDKLIIKGMRDMPGPPGLDPSTLKKWKKEAVAGWLGAKHFAGASEGELKNAFIRHILSTAHDEGVGAEYIMKDVLKPGAITNVRKLKEALGIKPFDARTEHGITRVFQPKMPKGPKEMLDFDEVLKDVDPSLLERPKYKKDKEMMEYITWRTAAQKEQDEIVWRKVQAMSMETFLNRVSNKDGEIMGHRILTEMRHSGESWGREMMEELWGDTLVDEMKSLGKFLAARQAKQEGAGRVMIQLGQAGALFQLAVDPTSLPALAMLVGPAVFARLMTNPRTVRWLTEGLTQMPTMKAAQLAGFATRLSAMSMRVKENIENDIRSENLYQTSKGVSYAKGKEPIINPYRDLINK